MGVVLLLLSRVGVLESGFGMRHEHIGVSLFAVVDGLFSVLYGFGEVIFCEGKTRSQKEGDLTAVVRKKLGLMLVSEKNGEERVYRIAANDVAPKRKAGSDRKAA
jgi:hypothetical protein